MVKHVAPVQSSTYTLNAAYNPIYFDSGTKITTNGVAGVYGSGATNWTVTNTGSISATNLNHNSGIQLQGAGTVTNKASGVIKATGNYARAVFVGGAGQINNAGQLYGSGSHVQGVLTKGGAGVDNTGTIKVSTGASGQHASAVNMQAGGAFTNEAGGQLQAYGAYIDGANVYAGGSVTNFGSISVTGNATGRGDGVQLQAGGRVFNRSGGLISVSGLYMTGVAVDQGGAVYNYGTISGFGTQISAVGFFGGTGSLNNSGSISVTGGNISGVYALAAVTIVNSGSISVRLTAPHVNGAGVDLNNGGSLTNQSGGSIYGYGQYVSGVFLNNGARADNYGSISVVANSVGNDSVVNLQTASAAFRNHSGATITGSGRFIAGIGLQNGGAAYNDGAITMNGVGDNGFFLANGGKATNTGTITSTGQAQGFWSSNGGTFINKTGGKVSGDTAGVANAHPFFDAAGGALTFQNESGATVTGKSGVFANGVGDSVVNAGVITGATAASYSYNGHNWRFGDGVFLGQSATSLYNAAGGSITGVSAGVFTGGANATVTNAGAIGGFDGVKLNAGGVLLNQGGATISATGQATKGVWPPAVGVAAYGVAANVTNNGAIVANGYDAFGVYLAAGGTLTNTGSIKGEGDLSIGVTSSTTGVSKIINSGLIADYGAAAASIYLVGNGGTVTNQGAGVILTSIVLDGSQRTIDNSGRIDGLTSVGVDLSNRHANAGGANVTNRLGGLITGDTGGVAAFHTGANVYNFGTISGTQVSSYYNPFDKIAVKGGSGVNLLLGGKVVNNSGAAISGARYGVYVTGGAASVTNAGAIGGAQGAVVFAGGGANTLTLRAGSSLSGAVVGSTAAGATNALILQGAGSAANAFSNFTTLDAQAGASWSLSGAASFGAATVEGGLTVGAGVVASFTISGGTLSFSGASSDAVAFQGSGLLNVGAGFSGAISGFGAGDTFAFQGAADQTSYSGGVLTLTKSGAVVGQFTFNGVPLGQGFAIQSSSGGITDVVLLPNPATVAQYSAATAKYDTMGGLTIADSAPNILAALGALNADAHVAGVVLSSGAATFGSGVSINAPSVSETGVGTSLTIAENLSLAKTFSQGAGAAISVSSGFVLTLSGASTLAGAVGGAGGLALKGAATLNAGAKITTTAWTVSGTGTLATLNESLTYANAFTLASGAGVSVSSGGLLNLSGGAAFNGAVAGAGAMLLSGGASSVSNTASLSMARWGVSGAATSVNVNGTFVVYGGVFTLGAGATVNIAAKDSLKLTGTSNLSGNIAGAGTLALAGGAATFLSGATVSAANWTLLSGGGTTVAENLSYAGAFSQASLPALAVGAGDTLTLAGSAALNGLVRGAGTLALTGTATIAGGGVLNVANWSVTGAVTLAKNFAYAGNLNASGGATLSLSGPSAGLILQGQSVFAGATINGSGAVISAGAGGVVTVSGLTIGGGVAWSNIRTITQNNGSLTLGDASSAAATLSNGRSGIYNIIDDSDIALGGKGSIGNAGIFEKTGGAHVSTVAPGIANTGLILAASGVLEVQGAVTGSGSMQVKNAAVLQLDGQVASSQTLSFGSGGGELFLNDLAVGGQQLFQGVIRGWAAGDALDVGTAFGAAALFSFQENGGHTGGVLTVSGGGASASIAFGGLSGVVTKANFAESVDSTGATLFTYHA